MIKLAKGEGEVYNRGIRKKFSSTHALRQFNDMTPTYGITDMFKHWHWAELLWLMVATGAVLSVSLLLGDNLMGMASALTGIICVILTAKGKPAAYYFGIINCILYGVIAYHETLYGETVLNIGYYLPLQFIGFKIWLRHMNTAQAVVKPIQLNTVQRVYLLVSVVVATAGLGWILKCCGDEIPYIDAYTTIASILAMTLSARRNAEQWYLWISINLFSIYMWTERFMTNGENCATLMMWVIYLFNSIYGLYKWTRK